MMAEFRLQSMTGFGRAQAQTAAGQFTVELQTVNSRFQDFNISLPRELGQFESALRAMIKEKIPRGKIDCRVRYTPGEAGQPQVTINLALARQYVERLAQLQALGATGELSLQALTSLPGVLEIKAAELNEQSILESIQAVAAQALEALQAERRREGQALGEALHEMMLQLRALVEEADKSKDEVVQRYRERLTARVAELEANIKTQLEPGRLEMEVALFADRSDVSEELVRLKTHLERFESLIQNKDGAPAGKNLDFLVQELNREVNTLGSKVRETKVTGLTLEMKSIVERIREQIQNVQ